MVWVKKGGDFKAVHASEVMPQVWGSFDKPSPTPPPHNGHEEVGTILRCREPWFPVFDLWEKMHERQARVRFHCTKTVQNVIKILAIGLTLLMVGTQ